MRLHFTRKTAAWLILLGNAVLWLFPSNIVKQIATNRETLLGWYSEEKFSLQLVLLLISLPIVYVLRASGRKARKRLFRVMAILLVLLPGLAVVDVVARTIRKPRYMQHEGFRSRPANATWELGFQDVPEVKRSFPNAPAGYPPVRCKLSTDSRGFRNPVAMDRCDILAVGDSFTEGSKVSDDQPWPVLLGRKSGQMVYNVGMSGSDTQEYLLAFEKIGRAMKPRLVFCMIFEGNDFRGTNISQNRGRAKPPRGWRAVEKFFKESPLVPPIRQGLVRLLAPINADGPVFGGDILSWLPVGVGEPNTRYYAFGPKDLLDLCQSPEGFAQSRGWKDTAVAISELSKACRADGARLVVVFTPLKSHVILPLVKDHLPADKVRAFAALDGRNLPPADEFMRKLLAGLEVRESVLAEFCRQEGIDFVTTTPELREGMAQGRQLYYTYDQHWTPEGHEVVAEKLFKTVCK